MQTVILVVHILACLTLIGVVLLQRSEGGALSGLGGGGGGGGLMTGQSAAGALVRTTMIFGAVFFLTSLVMARIANDEAQREEAPPEAVLDGSGALDPAGDPLDLTAGDLLDQTDRVSSDPLEAGGDASAVEDPLAAPEPATEETPAPEDDAATPDEPQ